jgi:hypothetical protein
MAAVTLNGKWIELFRAGNYGEKGSYTAADIDKMVANYDPAKHEAPVVMGHPEMDAPAYGWVEAVKRSGNVLLGKLKQVPDQFSQLVDQGRFKKRSISFYRGENGPSLRHVGFLGAMPPEVKGLADVKLASFSAGAFQAIEFKEEEDMDAEQVGKSVTQSLKEFFAEFFKGKKVVDLGEGDQSKAIETAVTAALKPLQEGYTKLSQEFADYKKESEKKTATAATQTQAQFADTQIARVKAVQGSWVPAFEKMGVPQIFTELAKSETKVTFGEGDKKTEKPVAEVFADFLLGLKKMVPGGVLAEPVSEKRQGNLIRFNEPKDAHSVIDQESVALAEAATVLSQKEKIPFGEALNRLRASGDYEAGSTASGQV